MTPVGWSILRGAQKVHRPEVGKKWVHPQVHIACPVVLFKGYRTQVVSCKLAKNWERHQVCTSENGGAHTPREYMGYCEGMSGNGG